MTTTFIILGITIVLFIWGRWPAIGRISPERLTALRRIATVESVGSSTRIEGAKLTDKEVERLISGLEVETFASRDEEEVADYAETMETVFAHSENVPLTENHIKQLHRDLLQYASKAEREQKPMDGSYDEQTSGIHWRLPLFASRRFSPVRLATFVVRAA